MDEKLDFAFPERREANRIRKELELQEKAEAKAALKLKESNSATPTEENGETDLTGIEFKFDAADTLMENSVYEEKFAPLDILGELFKEGGQDPAALMEHPCPPGKKDKTMRTDLMSFQVGYFFFSWFEFTDESILETRISLDDQYGTSKVTGECGRSASTIVD